MVESERKIVFLQPVDRWVLADILPGETISIVRYFYSYQQAKNWHSTYGFPMKTTEKDYSNLWYNKI